MAGDAGGEATNRESPDGTLGSTGAGERSCAVDGDTTGDESGPDLRAARDGEHGRGDVVFYLRLSTTEGNTLPELPAYETWGELRAAFR